VRASELYSRAINSAMSKTPTLAKIKQTSRSVEGSSSKVLGLVSFSFCTQYKGNPSSVARS